uniref:Uncharacterized protein n=1 Tax=Glossina austeni TaxID=7395 RepID=A0A1A9VPQ5_GLOAU
MSEANLFDINTKHSWVSSPCCCATDDDESLTELPQPLEDDEPSTVLMLFAMKLKNFLTPFSSAHANKEMVFFHLFLGIRACALAFCFTFGNRGHSNGRLSMARV